MLLLLLLIVFWSTIIATAEECLSRRYKSGSSIVCVCNAKYCDKIPKIEKIDSGFFEIYTSSQDGLRFYKNSGKFSGESYTKNPRM